METGIHIGHKIEETTSSLEDIIRTIFTVGYSTHMDQETIREALKSVNAVLKLPSKVSLSNNNIKGE